MNIELLYLLRCPKTGQPFELQSAEYENGKVMEGWLVTTDGKNKYPIRNYIPRFVPESNYADNFGMQWNMFRQTQLDSYSGHPISTDRFWKATGWKPEDIAGKWVLDCGCGAGRFAEVALNAGANLIAVDYSSAVDACYANLKSHPNLNLVQGNIFELPFLRGEFSHVYSLGVLQHTPDVEQAFKSLPEMVAPGGKLCVDFYERNFRSKLLPKYWLRPITKRMDKNKLFDLLQKWVPRLFPVSVGLGRVPLVGGLLKRVVPIANYKGILPLNDKQLKEWALLDTFDWLAPEFDNPQNASTINTWFNEVDFDKIEIFKESHLVGRGVKPQ
jgi:2-polyprenyl-3-methyl-5-hydroxy-6-metoxy-1,4-benzoquinol methylase